MIFALVSCSLSPGALEVLGPLAGMPLGVLNIILFWMGNRALRREYLRQGWERFLVANLPAVVYLSSAMVLLGFNIHHYL